MNQRPQRALSRRSFFGLVGGLATVTVGVALSRVLAGGEVRSSSGGPTAAASAPGVTATLPTAVSTTATPPPRKGALLIHGAGDSSLDPEFTG